jgi:hypothetical protein
MDTQPERQAYLFCTVFYQGVRPCPANVPSWCRDPGQVRLPAGAPRVPPDTRGTLWGNVGLQLRLREGHRQDRGLPPPQGGNGLLERPAIESKVVQQGHQSALVGARIGETVDIVRMKRRVADLSRGPTLHHTQYTGLPHALPCVGVSPVSRLLPRSCAPRAPAHQTTTSSNAQPCVPTEGGKKRARTRRRRHASQPSGWSKTRDRLAAAAVTR